MWEAFDGLRDGHPLDDLVDRDRLAFGPGNEVRRREIGIDGGNVGILPATWLFNGEDPEVDLGIESPLRDALRLLMTAAAAWPESTVNGRRSVVMDGKAAQLVIDVAGGSIVDFHLREQNLNPFRWESPGGPAEPRPAEPRQRWKAEQWATVRKNSRTRCMK